MTGQVLADRLGMDPTQLRKIEGGKSNLTMTTLVRVANGLGCKSLEPLFRRPVAAKAKRRAA